MLETISEPTDESEKFQHKRNEARAERILIDSIKDHLVPHIAELNTATEMFDALVNLFESKTTSRKIALRHQLRYVSMPKSDSVATYLMRVSQLKDQLKAIGDTIEDQELVLVALTGFPPSWEPFIQSICRRAEMPKFDQLWADCVQEARIL